MRIGAAAKAIGISTSAIRFYERKGLIRPIGRVSGRRELDQSTLLTLKFLKFAQSAGFTLDEAARLLDIGFGDTRDHKDWLSLLERKRASVRDQIDDLQRMDELLGKFQTCSCADLSDCMLASSSAGTGEQGID